MKFSVKLTLCYFIKNKLKSQHNKKIEILQIRLFHKRKKSKYSSKYMETVDEHISAIKCFKILRNEILRII